MPDSRRCYLNNSWRGPLIFAVAWIREVASWLLGNAGIFAHLFLGYVIWKRHGVTSGLATLLLPVLSEIYWSIKTAFLHDYVIGICFVTWIILYVFFRFGLVFIAFRVFSEKPKREDKPYKTPWFITWIAVFNAYGSIEFFRISYKWSKLIPVYIENIKLYSLGKAIGLFFFIFGIPALLLLCGCFSIIVSISLETRREWARKIIVGFYAVCSIFTFFRADFLQTAIFILLLVCLCKSDVVVAFQHPVTEGDDEEWKRLLIRVKKIFYTSNSRT